MKRLFAIRHLVVLAVAAATTLMVSCFKDDIIELPSGKPSLPTASEYIAFQADAQWADEDVISRNAATRNRVGKHDLISEDGELSLPMGVYVEEGICGTTDNGKTRGAVLSAIGDSFTVWASLTNGENTELFFEGLVFTDDGTSYKSDPAYFWPGAGTFSFTAVANAPATGFTPNLNTAGTALESFTYTVPADATAQNDIVLATLKDVNGDANATQALNFKHIMSAVNFKVGNISNGTIKSITLKGIYNKGTYNVTTGRWTIDKSSTTDYTVKFSDDETEFIVDDNTTSGVTINADSATFMFIPQEPAEGAVIEVVFNNGDSTAPTSASIAGDIWDMNKTTSYILSIDQDFTLNVEPQGKKLDAHYIITDVKVTVERIAEWEISAKANDNVEVTILPYDEANPLAQAGFWTDKEVDAAGKVLKDENGNDKSARGANSYKGSGDIEAKRFILFIPENISNKDRQITITLSSTESNSTATTTKVLLQKSPNWTGTIGWEVVDDEEEGKYGFKWNRAVAYEHKYGWKPPTFITPNGTGTWYNRESSAEYANSLISQYSASSFAITGYFQKSEGGAITGEERMYIFVDYRLLNNLSGASSTSDGHANTTALFNVGGSAASMAFETAIITAEKSASDTSSDRPAFRQIASVTDKATGTTYTTNDVAMDDLSGILTYILKKNRYYLYFEGGTTQTYHAYFNINDLVWYLPASGQFSEFVANPELDNDIPANYWSSTAADGTQYAYRGSGAQEDRATKLRVIAVRKDVKGYGTGTASVSVDNSSIAGGENGDANQWLE